MIGADPQLPARAGVHEFPGLREELPQPVEFGAVQREPCPVVQQHRLIARGERPEELFEGHVATGDGNPDMEIEPVVVTSILRAD